MPQDELLERLARQIDATKKAEHYNVSGEDIATLRPPGACALHAICADFVASVNSRLSEAELELAPLEYAAEAFRDAGANLFQIGSQGRQMQLSFESTRESVSRRSS